MRNSNIRVPSAQQYMSLYLLTLHLTFLSDFTEPNLLLVTQLAYLKWHLKIWMIQQFFYRCFSRDLTVTLHALIITLYGGDLTFFLKQNQMIWSRIHTFLLHKSTLWGLNFDWFSANYSLYCNDSSMHLYLTLYSI